MQLQLNVLKTNVLFVEPPLARLSTGLFHCVLYIIMMFTVTYFEGIADDCSLNTTTLTCRSYQDAKDLINTFEPWEEVRLDYVGTPSEDILPF